MKVSIDKVKHLISQMMNNENDLHADLLNDIKDVVHFLPGTAPEDIASGLMNLLNNDDLLQSKHEIQQKWLKAYSWSAMAYRLSGMIRALIQ